MTKSKKKIIEFALPLKEINDSSAREKSIKHGHPSTYHLWWARRPLAACRAILLAQLIDDPSNDSSLNSETINTKRNEILTLIGELAKWENLNNKVLIEKAKDLINQSVSSDELNFHDPFAGGGGIPLEAQRFGLNVSATDLNPVAVLINKSMIEIAPKFSHLPSVSTQPWDYSEKVNSNIAKDVANYGKLLSDIVYKKIGEFYPQVKINGENKNVMCWIWIRTVPSPDPSVKGKHVPLVSSFWLCKKSGKNTWAKVIKNGLKFSFEIMSEVPQNPAAVSSGTKMGKGANFKCIFSGSPISSDYVKQMGKEGKMGWRLMAVIAEGDKGRTYLSPTSLQEKAALSAKPNWTPEFPLSTHPQYMSVTNYGPKNISDLFMDRQSLCLSTFCESIEEVRKVIEKDGIKSGIEKGKSLKENGSGARAYSEAISIFLGLSISKLANRQSTNTFWDNSKENIQQVFARHALPFVWDTAEGNPFSNSSGNFLGQIKYTCKAIDNLPLDEKPGNIFQKDARQVDYGNKIISTDPPYYDNVPYADLSDFFYVWLRYGIKSYLPEIFKTILVPKNEELVADYKRHDGRDKAEEFFMDGMTDVLSNIAQKSNLNIPITIYYAFKQSEKKGDLRTSTGWETFLEAVIKSGYQITGTWPIRTELTTNLKKNWNALASSIVLVCRKKKEKSEVITRRNFISLLKNELRDAINILRESNIAAVDLDQSSIGPAMGIYSRYSKVIEPNGESMSIHSALGLINQVKDEIIAESENDFDPHTRWNVTWFEEFGFEPGEFGRANILAQAKNIGFEELEKRNLLTNKRGHTQLVHWKKYDDSWEFSANQEIIFWELLHYLIRYLELGGETEAAELINKVGSASDVCKNLAYRCFDICEKSGWAQEATYYNSLIISWPSLIQLSEKMREEDGN